MLDTQFDCYQVLNLPREAPCSEIKKAYRKLAIKWHPDKNLERKTEAEKRFRQLAEAYGILIDPDKRKLYDEGGFDALAEWEENGHDNKEKEDGESKNSKAKDVFQSFFGSNNPFENFGFGEKAIFSSRLKKSPPMKSKPILCDLPCSLEELFHGCIKTIKVTRKRILKKEEDENKKSNAVYYDESIILKVHVVPGSKEGKRRLFPCEGDEKESHTPGDLVIRIKKIKHKLYSIREDNLVYDTCINLVDALVGCSIEVPLLDGNSVKVHLSDIVYHGYEKVIEREGMSKSECSIERGDMIVRFKIKFPKYLDENTKKAVNQLLR